MVIDFHTHVYPDKIAARTLAALCDAADVSANTDGTLMGLLDSMARSGIDRSVVLPVATRAGQFDSITRFARFINENYPSLTSFGAIHPDDVSREQKLQSLKDSGFLGVKLHPDYQQTMIDDERYIDIICTCQRLGLVVLTHAGKDPAYSIVHCPPDRGRRMLDEVYRRTGFIDPFFVFAHLGGNRQQQEVERYLVGQNCYIDISCAFQSIGHFSNSSDEDVVRIIRAHGAEHILFATDSPWNDQKVYLDHFCALSALSDIEKEMILCHNAEALLNR